MSTRTHVVVLAQGTQRRLSGIRTPKQLLTLPAHEAGGVPRPNCTILGRTLMQVFKYLGGVGVTLENAAQRYNDHHVTVVAWPDVAAFLEVYPVRIPYLRRDGRNWINFAFTPEVVTLAEPGNSSLRGISNYLSLASVDHDEPDEFDGRPISLHPMRSRHWPDRTVVLLGDVVYSWECLRKIFRGSPARSDLAFVGTSSLTRESGELWGVMWQRSIDRHVYDAMRHALTRASNPEDEEYQPGQLRHWMWSIESGRTAVSQVVGNWYIPCDDYTVDVDLPEHLVNLAAASLEAVVDDRENGVVW